MTWTVTADDRDQLFAEQGRRWRRQAAGTPHERHVEHFCALVAEERALVGQILALAHELQAVTMERLLAKSDLEVGVEAIFGQPSGWGVRLALTSPNAAELGTTTSASAEARAARRRTPPDQHSTGPA